MVHRTGPSSQNRGTEGRQCTHNWPALLVARGHASFGMLKVSGFAFQVQGQLAL